MGSIDPGTDTTRLAGTVGGGVTTGDVTVGGEIVGGVVVLDPGWESPPDPLLQAPPTAATIKNAHKGLQTRGGRDDPRGMEASEFYPDAPDRPSQPDLAARVAELERVVATIASLRRERSLADRPDPVALTAALHPGAMRSTRGARRSTTSKGTIPLRFVLFDPSVSR